MGKANESFKGIQELVDEGISLVPSEFIRPVDDRPCFSEGSDAQQIPVIDLVDLLGDGRTHVIQEIGRACEDWGFFQVIHHGVQQEVIERMWAAAQKFFQQAPEEKMRFHSKNYHSAVNYTTGSNPSQEAAVRDWRDTLSFQLLPGQCDGFQEAPEFCRGPLLEYLTQVQKLAAGIYKAVFESLGLSANYLETALPGTPRIMMGINYYPPCPDPSLTFGLGGHSDISCLTILLPGEVSGLQVQKADRWVAVKPLPNAFVVNIADQIEVLTNGKYKSVEHRVVTNSEKPRMSIACFFGPREDTRIGPLSKLIDENNPALYKETMFGDYVKNFYSRKLLPNRATLDLTKASS